MSQSRTAENHPGHESSNTTIDMIVGAALEAHLRSEAYRRILGAIELSGGPPDVRFDHVSATEGMDLIERSRKPGGMTPQGDDGTRDEIHVSTDRARPR